MDYQKDIIVIDKLGVVPTDSEVEYLAHLLCLGGTCRYRFNERDFELHAGDLSIIRQAETDRENRTVGRFPVQDHLCETRFHRFVHAAEQLRHERARWRCFSTP